MKIYWYCPYKIFEAFEEIEDNPSFRLRCLYTHKNLLKQGYSSKIVHHSSDIKNPDIVILMSFGEEELALARCAKNHGAKIIHDYSENIRGIPVLEETKKLCDKIVCCSTALGNLEKINYPHQVVVVKDPIEDSPVIHNPLFSNDKLKVVWMGMGGNASWVSNLLKPLVESLDMEYIEISNRKEASIPWNRKTWQIDMASCDIALCPQVHWQFPAKSNVKVTTALSLGLPVIASPILSYTEIIIDNFNGFICNDLDQWYISLNKLKSKKLRESFVAKSQTFISHYHRDVIYKEWEAVFKYVWGITS